MNLYILFGQWNGGSLFERQEGEVEGRKTTIRRIRAAMTSRRMYDDGAGQAISGLLGSDSAIDMTGHHHRQLAYTRPGLFADGLREAGGKWLVSEAINATDACRDLIPSVIGN